MIGQREGYKLIAWNAVGSKIEGFSGILSGLLNKYKGGKLEMKRIVIIFTIVCVLLSFVGVAYPAEETIKPPKPGDFWNRLVNLDEMIGHKISDTMKGLYIKGVAQGILLTLGLIDLSEIDKEGIIIDYGYFILKHIEEIRRIMDDLYKDPANVNIQISWMCGVATDKLKGEDVEDLIQDYRMMGLIPGFY